MYVKLWIKKKEKCLSYKAEFCLQYTKIKKKKTIDGDTDKSHRKWSIHRFLRNIMFDDEDNKLPDKMLTRDFVFTYQSSSMMIIINSVFLQHLHSSAIWRTSNMPAPSATTVYCPLGIKHIDFYNTEGYEHN